MVLKVDPATTASTATPNEKELFECTICHKHYKNKNSLRNHIAYIHESKKPFECNICQKKFYLSYNLNQHN